MELYLDSANLAEIKEAFQLEFLTGLTTTPTFMHRDGVADVDALILELAKIVPILQVEALGTKKDEIVKEAYRQVDMGLDPKKSVFKIPVSMEGVKACYELRKNDLLVNVHLIYTLQQAYMAMEAGATYACPLVGRLQDQGHDALDLVSQCVETVDSYGYDTKIMFSSVRYPEHVRNALNIGVHTCTVPWKVMKQLTENNFTTLGTNQFFEHTKLMTVKIRDVVGKTNPTATREDSVTDALVKMTAGGYGCITVVDSDGKPIGAFTDGDLRRLIEKDGHAGIDKKLADLEFGTPVTIDGERLLNEASEVFHEREVDNLIVTLDGKVVGILDIQDLN